jgi:LPXTG-motif cell wall-anchored protein
MNKPVSLVLLVGGIVLLIYGANASDSIGSSFSRLFTGSPTDQTIWLLIGGLAATIIGAAGLLRRRRP